MKNNNYVNKERNAEHAKWVCEKNDKQYSNQIDECIKNTHIYNEKTMFPMFVVKSNINSCNIIITSQTTDASIIACNNELQCVNEKIAALNFASYRNAGGRFLDGSNAQEESLCHDSILYNVLRGFEDTYYKDNNKNLNRGLYLNRALYSKDILFTDLEDKYQYKCDIITCAAPNLNYALRYQAVSGREIKNAIRSRIEFVLNIAACENVDTLILGAFGCGVFKNDPLYVAQTFMDLLFNKYKKYFKRIIFAIPDGVNHDVFVKQLSSYYNEVR